MKLFVYCDASFSPSKKTAVIGYIAFEDQLDQTNLNFADGIVKYIHIEVATNTRAEIHAVIFAFENILKSRLDAGAEAPSIELFTDCSAVSGLFSRRIKLEHNNYIGIKRQRPLNNADLYKQFFSLYDLVQPKINWIKGHKKKSLKNQHDERFGLLDHTIRERLRKLDFQK